MGTVQRFTVGQPTASCVCPVRRPDEDGTERADAVVEGVGKRFVWLRIPAYDENRIFTVLRENIPAMRRHPKSGDSVTVGWVGGTYRQKWGLPLTIHWTASHLHQSYPLVLTEWEMRPEWEKP